ncbi:GNAT family N-acetyltransferase [Colwellia sp. 1_MG-2023]|uniref:GNAT family N-acetyltransferase n=1 Tax=Colwellia sp. 1_MG-2023 TaxID=3062649 RepID=UPI0026E31FD8|nr:GNAT family N-acetyltransferase [Colwellia sp. 1_MG-2023]MDO6444431.1 GNAT family N-acetyltransferase [Colwellia sp. 1_MG-2023]
MNYLIKHEPPTVQSFVELRAKVGWGTIDLVMAKQSIEQSLFHVSVYLENKLIGMARVIGDGVMYFYIQDLVVSPQFQQRGIGHTLMQEIEQYLAQTAKKGATIALLSAQGKEEFYSQYGYIKRSGNPLGKAMCKFI